MNRIALLGFHRPEIVHRLAQHIQHAPERRAAHGDRDRFAEVFRVHAAHHTLGRLHRDAAHAPFAEMLLDLRHHVERFRDIESLARDPHRAVNRRQMVLLKKHVHHGPDHFHDMPDFRLIRCHVKPP